MPADADSIELTLDELRAVAGFAAACAQRVLPVFEAAAPDDTRPREAIGAALAFAGGGPRAAALRTAALASLRAARESSSPAAAEAARAAGHAAGSAYLHPLASADQVKHILGSAACAARAAELDAGDDRRVGAATLARAVGQASATVRALLARYPAAPPGGGRVGELMRDLDAALRG